MLEAGDAKGSSLNSLPVEAPLVSNAAPMWQTREVEFAEKCLQPREEGLKRYRVN